MVQRPTTDLGILFFPRPVIPLITTKDRQETLYSSTCFTCEKETKKATTCKIVGSRDGVFGIATGYGLDDRGIGVRVPVGSRIFSTSSRPAVGPTKPLIQWVPGALSAGVKRQGREADHSPPPSAEVKKMWIYTSTPPYAFMAWCLISLSTGKTLLYL
jgi:hypothetical protein